MYGEFWNKFRKKNLLFDNAPCKGYNILTKTAGR